MDYYSQYYKKSLYKTILGNIFRSNDFGQDEIYCKKVAWMITKELKKIQDPRIQNRIKELYH